MRNSICFSHAGGRGPSAWTIIYQPSRHISSSWIRSRLLGFEPVLDFKVVPQVLTNLLLCNASPLLLILILKMSEMCLKLTPFKLDLFGCFRKLHVPLFFQHFLIQAGLCFRESWEKITLRNPELVLGLPLTGITAP